MKALLASVLLALLVAFLPSVAAQGSCTVRSGTDVVTFTPHNGGVVLAPGDFTLAASGAATSVVATFPGWISGLPCDPLAQWISTNPNSSLGVSSLLAVSFPCPISPCFGQAFLNVCYAVDNNLGSTVNQGLFLNGQPIAGTTLLGGLASNFGTQHSFVSLNVTTLVVAGTNTLYLLVDNVSGPMGVIFSATLTTTATGLCEPLDTSFVVPTMSGAASSDPLQRNDDGSSGPIALGFNFCFYGTTYTDVYLNNNGTVTFGAPFAAFTRVGFPLASIPMIAPFWSDVDTRNLASGVVRYKLSPTRITVLWDHVGYFNSHVDKLNTFEVILSDGTDTLVGAGHNVCFCYDDMNWTTGDASGGIGGFGGTAANVGINVGDGTNSTTIGRFDHAGPGYDGPANTNDGVDWLDCKRLCFDTCGCGQQGQVGLNDLTINGSYPNSHSGLTIYVPAPGVATISFSTVPFASVTLLVSLDCHCPGIPTPFGEFHLDPATMIALFDGCGVFGAPGPFFTNGAGLFSLPVPIPASLAGVCVCVQGLICSPALPFGLILTQSYKVCFI